MIIKIDVRETALIKALEELALTALQAVEKESKVSLETEIIIKKEALPIGDCILCNNDNTERIIIERKTLTDLAASIRDGRYNEQSFRLNNCALHNHNIIYLVEGDVENFNPGRSKIGKDALISSFISINFFKGFSLYRTNNVKESANWVYQLTKKLGKNLEKKGYFENILGCEVNESSVSYSETLKRTKKECINTYNIGEIMLSQIPNVSITVATHLMNIFGNIVNLARCLKDNPDALLGIQVEGKSGKSRQISKIARESIYRYLVSEARSVKIEEKGCDC